MSDNVKINLDDVKTGVGILAVMNDTGATSYHHGDLPNALRAAAAEVIAEQGLAAFSLREVARRAGVSHAAPGYHFGDTAGLLTSLAEEGFGVLGEELATALDGIDDPVEKLIAVGHAYVKVATERPAHFEVIFRADVVDDDVVQVVGSAAFAFLEQTVRELADRYRPDLDVRTAAYLCWSAMQGLVVLRPKFERLSAVDGLPPVDLDGLVERFTTLMLEGIIGTDVGAPVT